MGTIDRDTIVSNPIFINLELCFTMLVGVWVYVLTMQLRGGSRIFLRRGSTIKE